MVRSVIDDGVLYALKELSEKFARREYRLLRSLAELGVPAGAADGTGYGTGDRQPLEADASSE